MENMPDMDSMASDRSASNPYVPLYPYNGTTATGGDPLAVDLNQFYQSGDMAWVLMSTVLVLLQVPGFGFFYSGLARRKSALSLLWLMLMSIGVVSFQWFFWGYSLSFSHTANAFIGDLANFGFKGVLAQPSVGSFKIPDLLYATYQCMFAVLTNTIWVGAAAERGRILPTLVVMFIWTTLIYNPIACWTWNPMGWSFMLGALDFSGGGPVHINAGCAALAYSLAIGKRKGYGTSKLNYRPHNVTLIVLGTIFIWLGWLGFNGGSSLGASLRGTVALFNTNLAGAMGGITWCLLDYRLERKWSTVGFCSGAVAGLVCVTPASGFIPPWASLICGIVGSAACNLATGLKYYFGADDAMDIFAIHAIGGFTGNILTAFFAADYIAALDGYTVIAGGWINRNWVQLGIQLADSVTDVAYSLVGTYLILRVVDLIPGLGLRITEDEEDRGIDDTELGEFAYDFVELTREVHQSKEISDEDMPSEQPKKPFAPFDGPFSAPRV